MSKRDEIEVLLQGKKIGETVTVKGWVRTFRNNQFIALNDGSTINNIQVVVDFENTDAALLKRITTGAAIRATGKLIESQGKGQTVELVADEVETQKTQLGVFALDCAFTSTYQYV
jgi:asparaginyl-tRNA synthetase